MTYKRNYLPYFVLCQFFPPNVFARELLLASKNNYESSHLCWRKYSMFGWNLLTPWCRVLLEKLTGLQLVKKFPAFYGTRRFITALTSVRHLSLSRANPIQSTYLHPTSWRSILILSTHLRLGLPSGLFPSGFPTKTLHNPQLYSVKWVTRVTTGSNTRKDFLLNQCCLRTYQCRNTNNNTNNNLVFLRADLTL